MHSINALKLEFNNKNNSRKYTNNWRLNNTLLNDQWVLAEITEEKSFLEANKNQNTACQNLLDIAKAVLRGKFIAMSVYIKGTERSEINNLMPHLKLLQKQERANPKTNRRREIIKNKGQN
jgi:hypothetical protein